jgi:hypothetical protein
MKAIRDKHVTLTVECPDPLDLNGCVQFQYSRQPVFVKHYYFHLGDAATLEKGWPPAYPSSLLSATPGGGGLWIRGIPGRRHANSPG